MQTGDTIIACSGGQISILVGVENYYLASADIATLLVYGKEVPLYLDTGVIDADSSAFQHPGKKGIVFAIMGEAWLVPKEAFVDVARGAIAETEMLPIVWRGPVS